MPEVPKIVGRTIAWIITILSVTLLLLEIYTPSTSVGSGIGVLISLLMFIAGLVTLHATKNSGR